MGRTFFLVFTSRMYQISHVCLGLEWEGLQSEDSFGVVGETGGEVWAVGGGDGIVGTGVEDGGDGMVAEDVIYKVSVQRWPLQQLPPVAFDGIITPL